MTEATPLASEQITQEDREAAAEWMKDPEPVLAGRSDGWQLVQAFARHRIAALSASPAPSGQARCANCGGSDFKSVIAGDDGEAFCSVGCADQHGELGCPLETGSAYRAHIPSESERIMRAAINDIADAEPIPTPIDAFEWCVMVAQDAVNRIAALSPQGLDAATVEQCAQVAESLTRKVPYDYNPHPCYMTMRQAAAAIRALATEPHQHGGKGA